jgi:hypothetical protein
MRDRHTSSQSGQVPVQHHHVVGVDLDLGESLAAVEDHVDGHPFPAQDPSDGLG